MTTLNDLKACAYDDLKILDLLLTERRDVESGAARPPLDGGVFLVSVLVDVHVDGGGILVIGRCGSDDGGTSILDWE